MNLKIRLTALNFLEFAVWGAYLTSMGTYLASVGLATNIGWFYAMQGMVSIFTFISLSMSNSYEDGIA